ncbi:hypothetical protein [Actinokineospora sp.]|uniref:hypothetical protein n=1 Tax=Actinokineospora sp. TaxID=1872133 RepID=UPI003D6A7930
MVAFGYTLMTEQAGPADLVRHAVAAEGAGIDFEVMIATETVGLMTYVTCPIPRYYPAIRPGRRRRGRR